jgi:predicted metal-binding protein
MTLSFWILLKILSLTQRSQSIHVFVCSKCNSKENPESQTSGLLLFKSIISACKRRYKEIPQGIKDHNSFKIHSNQILHIKTIKCLSACSFTNTLAISSAEKYKYQFGSLTPEDSEEILDFIDLYSLSPKGFTKKKERPFKLKDTVLARIPPLQGTDLPNVPSSNSD